MKTNISECIIIKKIFLSFVSFPPYPSAITSYAFVCVCVCVLKCFPNIFPFKFPTVWQVQTNYVCECTKTDRSLRKSFKETTKKRGKCVLQSCPFFLPNVLLAFFNMSLSQVFIYCTSKFGFRVGKNYRNSLLRSQCMENGDSTSRSILIKYT